MLPSLDLFYVAFTCGALLVSLSSAKTVEYFTWNETRFDTHTREIGADPDRFSDSFTIDYNRDPRWFTSQLVRTMNQHAIAHFAI